MTLDTSLPDYEEVDANGKLAKHQRQVKNPTTKEHENVTVYDIYDGGYVKVAKVSDLGWQVVEYDSSGQRVRSIDGLFDESAITDESEAHEQAKDWIKEALR